jgi:hypothetical protein
VLASDELILTIDTVTGIHSLGRFETVDVFPNPSKGFISVHIPEFLSQERVYIEVYDGIGNLVFSWELSVSGLEVDRHHKLNLESLKSGTYYLHMRGTNYHGFQKLVLIR